VPAPVGTVLRWHHKRRRAIDPKINILEFLNFVQFTATRGSQMEFSSAQTNEELNNINASFGSIQFIVYSPKSQIRRATEEDPSPGWTEEQMSCDQ